MFKMEKVEIEESVIKKKNLPMVKQDISKRTKKINDLASQADLFLEQRNLSHLPAIMENLIKETVNLCNYVKRQSRNMGFANRINAVMADLVHCSIEEKDSVYHIRFDTLLPKKVNSWGGEKDNIYQMYVNGIHAAALSAGLPKWSGRVVMVIIHHFADEKAMIDYDNFELKSIIDAIAVHYLVDDSPKFYISHMDCVMGDDEFSEILLMSQEKFKNYVIGIY